MIVMEKQARYHLSYLKTLKTLRSGQFDNELLNDGIHRVMLARIGKADGMDYDNQVTIEVDERGNGSWKLVNEYPAETGPLYCLPDTGGKSSEPAAIARRITKMLDGMGWVNRHVCKGELPDMLDDLGYTIRWKLIAEGWRATATDNGWKVLPPRDGVRNDNARKAGT